MRAAVAKSRPVWFRLANSVVEPSRCIKKVESCRCCLYRTVLCGYPGGFVTRYAFALALAVVLCAPALGQDDWKDVDESQALLEFMNAKRTRTLQKKDGETTLERSYWTLDDGAAVAFVVTWLGRMWVLTNRGPTLEEIFHRALPNSELEEVGEPFVNRDGGTQGKAQWLRYRHQGNNCVLMRQFGWDDDAQILGAEIPLGNRVAVGFYCADMKLSETEIVQLFKRIDF